MIDRELLSKALKTVIDQRNDELSALHEMNGFTEEDDREYQALTDDYASQLAELSADEYVSKNDYLRLAADFDNYKKRVARNEQSANDRAYERVIVEFLKAYDDIERAVNALDNRSDEQKMFEAYDVNPVHSGIELAFENFQKTLAALGCEKIECKLGDKFDVNVMEAISARDIFEGESYQPDDVVAIYQSGWKRNGNVIRPVKVVVGKRAEA